MVIPSALPFYAPSTPSATPSALWASPPSKGGEEVSDREVKWEQERKQIQSPLPLLKGELPEGVRELNTEL